MAILVNEQLKRWGTTKKEEVVEIISQSDSVIIVKTKNDLYFSVHDKDITRYPNETTKFKDQINFKNRL